MIIHHPKTPENWYNAKDFQLYFQMKVKRMADCFNHNRFRHLDNDFFFHLCSWKMLYNAILAWLCHSFVSLMESHNGKRQMTFSLKALAVEMTGFPKLPNKLIKTRIIQELFSLHKLHSKWKSSHAINELSNSQTLTKFSKQKKGFCMCFAIILDFIELGFANTSPLNAVCLW